VLPLAMGAVVVGVPTTFQTPLSGHFCPVVAVVPIGARCEFTIYLYGFYLFWDYPHYAYMLLRKKILPPVAKKKI